MNVSFARKELCKSKISTCIAASALYQPSSVVQLALTAISMNGKKITSSTHWSITTKKRHI